MARLTDKVAFDLIRYANCWEDADVLLQGLALAPGKKILSVGSAGDNSFSLLVTDPQLVVAVDVNKTQLHLIALKKAAIQELEYEDVLEFLGFRPSTNREKLFRLLVDRLDEPCRNYWNANLEEIKAGIIDQGKFEKYFQLFSRRVLPFIHSKRKVAQLLEPKSAEEQLHFYNKQWNTWRWRLLFRIFFSRFVMGRLGRDPEFLKEVEVNVGQTIFEKAARQLQSVNAHSNFILHYNLTGTFGNLLPHYLQPGNFRLVKANLHKLHILEGYAEAACQQFGTFHAMNLSNIFEYMDPHLFSTTAQQLIGNMEKGGRLAYWNLMVTRRISEQFPGKVHFKSELSDTLTAQDKGFFYQQFIIDEYK